MKTLKVAALGVCALGLAALPVAGVFAETGDADMSFDETVQVTVPNVCGIYDAYTSPSSATNVGDNTYTAEVAVGAYTELGSATETTPVNFLIVCNDTNGWTLSAVGSKADATSVAHMKASTGSDDDLATGTSFTGDNGMWGFKIAAHGTGSTIADGYSNYAQIPTSAQTVLSSTGATDATTGTFQTEYKVYIGTQTPAGTYTGKVTYTLAHAAAAQQNEQQGNEEPQNSNNSQNSPDLVDAGNELGGGEQQGSGDSGNSGSGPLSMAAPSYNTTNVTNNSYNTTTTNTSTTTNMNTTGGSETGTSTNSNAGNGSGNEVEDGNAQALGVLTSSGSTTKQAQAGEGSDNSGWITLGVTAGIAAVGAATGVYIYKNKEA